MDKLDRKEVQWAELRLDMYDGPNCDQKRPEWHGYAVGDKDGHSVSGNIILNPKTFPPGTRVSIEEPICPKCREPRHFADINFSAFIDKCDCGFDWQAWEEGEFS